VIRLRFIQDIRDTKELMAAPLKIVEDWALPEVFPVEQVTLVLQSELASLYSGKNLSPATASALRHLSPEQTRQLRERHKSHLGNLLAPDIDKTSLHLEARKLGQKMSHCGLPLDWIAETYRHLVARLNERIFTLPVEVEERWKCSSVLHDRFFQDMVLLSAAYAGQPNINTSSDTSTQNALYRALMSGAELVVRAQTERELLDELCRMMVKSDLFAHVWIGRPNLTGTLEIESTFSSANMQDSWMPNVYTGDEEHNLIVRAWRQGKLQYSNDRVPELISSELQNFYHIYGLRSIAVVPLYRDGDLWAVLSLFSTQKGVFTPELLELLERIGRLVGHGLDAIDLRQILEQERQHQAWLARHDTLTDTLNRRGVVERLEEGISRTRRHKKLLAVAVMDLEGFKAINELHGHPAGDLLLRTLADRLQLTLRQTDAVGRLGSDEFVLILEDLEHEDDLTMMLSRIQAAVEDPIRLTNGRSVIVRSNIGLTVFPQDDSAPERLLRHADRALDALKENESQPEQRWSVFQAEADQQKYIRQKAVLSLFRSGHLRVHYQPVIDLQTGTISGIEALARLVTEDDNHLLPGEFLPLLSEADLIALTHQVTTQSIQDLHRLDKAGFYVHVGINFEPTMLADAQAMQDLRRQVETSGLAPDRIILELLERADALSVSSTQQALRDLKTCGVRIALDDVGSAYSSLLRVKELPADIIKLDRSFLIGLERQPKELRFIMNLVHLAQTLGLGLVAEGIECAASADALAALGVKLAQGFSIARPMPIDDLLKWLKRYKPVSWGQPTSVLGAVAMQLRVLDASGRILEQRPSLMQHLLERNADWEREIGGSIRQDGPGASQLAAAHLAWHKTMEGLSAQPDGRVDIHAFQSARSAYEEEMFQAALAAETETVQ
jgi:diguanylate cyclase (GGDEF)-like protein